MVRCLWCAVLGVAINRIVIGEFSYQTLFNHGSVRASRKAKHRKTPTMTEICKAEALQAKCILAIQVAVKDAVSESILPVQEKTEKIYNRMFVDNGKTSIQTSLSNLEPILEDLQNLKSMRFQLKLQWGMLLGFATAVVGMIVWAVQSGIARVATHIGG